MTDPVTIRVPAGIGDFSWIYSKLCSLEASLNVEAPAGGPERCHSLTEILPRVASMKYADFSYVDVMRETISPNASRQELLKALTNSTVYIEGNRHLEAGHRIERWLPELPVDHHYPITISAEAQIAAAPWTPNVPFLAFFAASEGAVANWKAWTEIEWADFCQAIRQKTGWQDFVVIGAEWDRSMGERIVTEFQKRDLPLVNAIGELPLAASLHIIQQAEYFVSFPSGLGILAAVLNQPALMFYPPHLDKMIGAWADPAMIENQKFIETLFLPPASAVAQIRERWSEVKCS